MKRLSFNSKGTCLTIQVPWFHFRAIKGPDAFSRHRNPGNIIKHGTVLHQRRFHLPLRHVAGKTGDFLQVDRRQSFMGGNLGAQFAPEVAILAGTHGVIKIIAHQAGGVVSLADLMHFSTGNTSVRSLPTCHMAINTLESCPNMDVGTNIVGSAFFLPVRFPMTVEAIFGWNFPDHGQDDLTVGPKRGEIIFELWLFMAGHTARHRGKARPGGGRPSEVQGLYLFFAETISIFRHVTHETVRLKHTALYPTGLVIIAVKVVVTTGDYVIFRVGGKEVIAFAVAVIFGRAAAGMTAAAGLDKGIGGKVDGPGIAV